MEKNVIRKCENCSIEFEISPRFLRSKAKQGKTPGRFCSPKCSGEFNQKRISLICGNCGASFELAPCRVSTSNGKNKSDRNFCSSSCAATYNNTHKKHGTRRSKLEAYLESQLRSEFPNLELICNGKEAINSELDFYFPQLRLAIELNGIFHYEPIYGVNQLDRIQRNDQQKYANCLAAGIELCVIACTENFTSNVKERYWSIVKDLVTPLLKRAGNTNVQVS